MINMGTLALPAPRQMPAMQWEKASRTIEERLRARLPRAERDHLGRVGEQERCNRARAARCAAPMTSAMTTEQRMPNRAPALARSNFCAPRFWPMKVVRDMRKAGDGQKGEALDAGIAAAARHGVVAEGIDIRLHDDVGDGDDGILNARRQARTAGSAPAYPYGSGFP